ncbi:MAG TPA: hypothetical protein DCM33_02390, partial [Acinetobacter radioresistens]|nr:hypothetical protein [Acinetobacter radioresistens]
MPQESQKKFLMTVFNIDLQLSIAGYTRTEDLKIAVQYPEIRPVAHAVAPSPADIRHGLPV